MNSCFENMTVVQLKAEQKKRGILDSDIKGRGKNGSVLKSDRVDALNKKEALKSLIKINRKSSAHRKPKPLKKTGGDAPQETVNISGLANKEVLVTTLVQNNYKAENYPLGIKVHMNSTKYIDISREPNNVLILDVCTKTGVDPNSLEILEGHGRIRSESLISILDSIKHKF